MAFDLLLDGGPTKRWQLEREQRRRRKRNQRKGWVDQALRPLLDGRLVEAAAAAVAERLTRKKSLAVTW
jgi:anti-sigma factor RsiW